MRLVYVTFAWVVGILLAVYGLIQTPLFWGVFVGAAVLVLVMLWRTDRRGWGLLLLVMMLGAWRASFMPNDSPLTAYHDVGGLTVTGVIVTEPDVRDTDTRFILQAESLTRLGTTRPIDGRVFVQTNQVRTLACGDRVQVTGWLETPAVYDTFNYADYLAARQVFSLTRGAGVETLEMGVACQPMRTLHTLKSNMADTINRMMPEPEAGLLVGILLGNERGLSPQLQADFAATGAAHIIAISGFNMAVLAGVVMGLLNRTPLSDWAAALIALAVIGAYTVLVGANAAVLRAAVMSGVLIVGEAIKRRSYVPASLAFVALLMSVQSPRVLWDVSFQLSFFATLGLALFATPFSRWFERGLQAILPRQWASGLAGFLGEPIVVTAAALVMTLPLTALYFQRVSLVQFAVNLLVVPVQSMVLIVGLVATGLAFIVPSVAQVLYWVVMGLLWWTVAVVRWFAGLSFADTVLYLNPLGVQVFFVVVMGGAVMQATQPTWAVRVGQWLRARLVITTTVWLGVIVAGLQVALVLARPDGLLHLYALDVGHSHGVLVQTAGGAQILIDGGRYPSRLLTQIGERMPFNDRHIELVIITQPDTNNYEALTAVFGRYSVGAVLTNGQSNQSDAYLALQAAGADYTWQTVTTGYVIDMDDGTRLEILHPTTVPELTDSLDANALTVRVSYGDVSYLVTGDLSAEGQVDLLAAGAWPLADVLILPQHAGQRALDVGFVEAVQPSVLILQSDKANRRGDPNPDTLALLDDTLPLLRTDAQGVIHTWTDGERLWTRH